MLGCFGVSSTFEMHVGNDRGNPAPLQKPFLWLGARERGLDNFHSCSSYVVFRAQSDDGTAAVKNVSNELESSGAHQAVRINSERDVVDGLAAMHSFGNHELLVFRPGKLRRQLRRRSVILIRRSRFVQQFADHGVERIDWW